MYNYIGGGTFLWGVPARTLTQEEAEVYGVDKLLASGLYESSVTPEETQKAVKPKAEDKAVRPVVENKEDGRR